MYLALFCSQILPNYLNFLSIRTDPSSILFLSLTQDTSSNCLNCSTLCWFYSLPATPLSTNYLPLNYHLRNLFAPSPIYALNISYLWGGEFMGSKFLKTSITENIFIPPLDLLCIVWLERETWMGDHFPLEL